MKKILLASAIALFAGLNAQTSFGVKGGYALSTLNSNENSFELDEAGGSLKSKSGFYIGALVEHKINSKFAFQGEVEYANLGGKMEVSIPGLPGVKVTEKMNFNRIVIPISARYYATPELAVYGGPYVSFKASNTVKIDVSGAMVTNQAALDEGERRIENFLDDSLKSTDFGLFFGADYKVYKGLFVDARYSFGLTNMIKNPVNDEKLKMNFFQLGVGYKFK
ncbi:PorT family protein [Chryseobacterium joostei]|uniref:Opacity protein n=1 Tax=Chryseobacterium joostei TaxID=112234 RepID=A0A1N7HWT0_9FLAO|nr:porin family protein [Chryseobacterium joostei]AZA98836.1 PorT family protein [Chryseobacterium joostei]SIS29297.1 Opacity protein [Chryseobacterium joostei]